MPVLHAIEGPLRGRIFGLPDKARLIVGRYEIYDVIVPEPSISRKHFVLERRPDGIYIIDLGSLNGTQLNGRRISSAKLEHCDVITVGQSVLCYDEMDSPTPPVTSVGFQVPALEEEEAGIEELTDDDIVEAAPTREVFELPDEIVELPAEVVGLPAEVVELADEASAADVPEPPPTVEMRASATREAIRKRRLRTEFGKRKTLRLSDPETRLPQIEPADSRRGSGKRSSGRTSPPVASGPAVDNCVACARDVSQEEMDAGEGARTRKGYLCGQCVDERQRSGIKGLEKFIRYMRKQKRG